MLSVNPELSAEQVRLVLTRSAEKILADEVNWLAVIGQDLESVFAYDATGHSIAFGYGRVDAARAVALALDTVTLGVVGSRCAAAADCAGGSCVAGVCLDGCATQDDCVDGTVCVAAVCELPIDKPGSFLSPCDDDACVACVNTFDSRFEAAQMCTIACTIDEDCEPSCADGECTPSRFDCRAATDDPDGLHICAVGDPNAGGPADFGACFNSQLFTSILVESLDGKELCGDICFGDGPGACAYGFHCAETLECSCTRDSAQFGCREYTCFESSNNGAGPFSGIFPICVPNADHADFCASDDDCQRGDYCNDKGVCRYDDRAGCDICAPCTSSDECGGRGVCIGGSQANPAGVCATACDDGEACPGDSACRDVNISLNGRQPRIQQVCLDGAVEDFVNATPADYCIGYTCNVVCRDDVPCPDNGICTAGVCGPAVGEGEGEGEGEGDSDEVVLGGGGVRWGGCSAVEPGSVVPLLGLLGLLRRRRRA